MTFPGAMPEKEMCAESGPVINMLLAGMDTFNPCHTYFLRGKDVSSFIHIFKVRRTGYQETEVTSTKSADFVT